MELAQGGAAVFFNYVLAAVTLLQEIIFIE